MAMTEEHGNVESEVDGADDVDGVDSTKDAEGVKDANEGKDTDIARTVESAKRIDGRASNDTALPRRASLSLVALRSAVLVLASAPALISGLLGTAGGPALRPYYTDVKGRLPLVHLYRLLQELPSSFLPAVVASILLSFLADQVLTGGALALVDLHRPLGQPVKVFTAVSREGSTHLWAFLRAALLGLVISAVGVVLLQLPQEQLNTLGYRSGWTGETVLGTLPLLGVMATLLWLATSGAWVFWCRLVTVADGRQRVRRTGLLALRVLWRRPLRAWGLFVALTVAPTLLSGTVLVAWRQAEPRSSAAAVLWWLAWLMTAVFQSFTWLLLLRAGRRLYAGERFADLRSSPDSPYRPLTTLKQWWQSRAAAN